MPYIDTQSTETTNPETEPVPTLAPTEPTMQAAADAIPEVENGWRAAVNVHGTAFTILVTLACVFALQWAQMFLIPLMFSVFLAYTLNPLVVWLERIRIPRVVGTTLVMIVIVGGAVVAANTLRAEFQSIVQTLPTATSKIVRAITKSQRGQPSTMQQMQAAASEIEKATSAATGVAPAPKKAVSPAQPTFRLSEWLWAGSMGAVEFIGQATMVLFLVFFLLLSGDTFKRKLVRITGPSFSNKKITVQILDDINISIQKYMFMLLVTNTLLALLMWLALRWIGLENAGAWAVGAGLLHIIPYFGPLMITVMSGLTAFMQFETVSTALLVAGTSLVIATLIGTFVTTWMTGRIAKMNPAAVFIGLLFWGWLWGIWGMLLGIPIIVIVKVIAEHVQGMSAIAELLKD